MVQQSLLEPLPSCPRVFFPFERCPPLCLAAISHPVAAPCATRYEADRDSRSWRCKSQASRQHLFDPACMVARSPPGCSAHGHTLKFSFCCLARRYNFDTPDTLGFQYRHNPQRDPVETGHTITPVCVRIKKCVGTRRAAIRSPGGDRSRVACRYGKGATPNQFACRSYPVHL